MKRMILVATGLLATSISMAATLNNYNDKLSYTLGFQTGHSLKQNQAAVDPSIFSEGLQAGYANKKPALSQAKMKSTLIKFKQQMIEKAKKGLAKQASANLKASKAFLAKNLKKSGVKQIEPGLQYKVLSMGKGPKPASTDRVSVTYVGQLSNGKVFDKSAKPVTFGLNQVIPGWSKALQQMPAGSEWMIYIAPNLAYGEQAPPMIGPNQALIFKVKLVKVMKK